MRRFRRLLDRIARTGDRGTRLVLPGSYEEAGRNVYLRPVCRLGGNWIYPAWVVLAGAVGTHAGRTASPRSSLWSRSKCPTPVANGRLERTQNRRGMDVKRDQTSREARC